MSIPPWALDSDLIAPDWSDAEEAIQTSTAILYELSGHRFGGARSILERYRVTCQTQRKHRCTLAPGSHCGAVPLRTSPVHSVESVSVVSGVLDLATVPDSSYTLLGARRLVPLTEGAWCIGSELEVQYTGGEVPSALARRACIDFANQLYYSWTGSEECRLPERVTSISRQGMSFTMLDPQEFLDSGRTGIYSVDLFLSAVNPDKARKRARVFSPDLPTALRMRGE